MVLAARPTLAEVPLADLSFAAVAQRLAGRERGGPLTPREMEVLELLRQGLTYAEIGQRLGVAQRTARAHVVAVKEKLAAANNAQAVARGFERGLLRPPRPA